MSRVQSGRCGRRWSRAERAGGARAVVSSSLSSRALCASGEAFHRATERGKRILLLRQVCRMLQTRVCGAGTVVGPPENGLLASISICRCSLWLRPPSVTGVILRRSCRPSSNHARHPRETRAGCRRRGWVTHGSRAGRGSYPCCPLPAALAGAASARDEIRLLHKPALRMWGQSSHHQCGHNFIIISTRIFICLF